MNAKHFAVQLLLVAIVLAAANVVVWSVGRGSIPRQVVLHGDEGKPATDLFLGNSTMAAGLDEAAFASATNGRPLNIAIGATDPVEHFLIYQRQSRHPRPAVYYGFLDLQLTDPPVGGWKKLVGNRAMAYYIDPETAIAFYSPDSVVQSLEHRTVSHLPALIERGSVWAKVEKLRRFLGGIGMPKKETNRFGRAQDFALLEADPDDFARRCDLAVANRVPLNTPITAIFNRAKELESPVYVVEMPMPSEHRHRFYSGGHWNEYRNCLMRMIREQGGEYVPAADWIADEGFADHVHLNADGAREFSIRLGKWAAERR